MRILWVKTELLHPVDKGGRIRSYQMLRCLLKDHEIVYVCLDDGLSSAEAHEKAREYCSELVTVPFRPAKKSSAAYALALLRNLISKQPYAVSRYRSDLQRRRVTELARHADLLVCDFLAPSLNISGEIGIKKVLFEHNVEAMIWQRRAAMARGTLRRAYLREQWRRMQRLEGQECRRFDSVIAVSDADAEVIRTQYGAGVVTSVPTGVDVDYFAPRMPSAQTTPELLFVGSMDWQPNEDGIRWFAENVFHMVRARIPDVSLSIVGRSPSKALLALAERYSNIRITGAVPDVRPYLQRAAVGIVPLRIGGGTRLKIYEAMATGVPVVSTAIGAEGLPLLSGQHLLIADDPEPMAAAITNLLLDRPSAQRLAATAQRFVQDHCSWQAVTNEFLAQCQGSRTTERTVESAIA